MSHYQNRQWIYARRPETEVGIEHYDLTEQTLDSDQLGDDEILVKARYWSVDPYMRIQQANHTTWEAPHPVGAVQGGGMVGQVIATGSKVSGLAASDWVNAYTGWQEYAVCPSDEAIRLDPDTAPVTTALGVLGMPGRTAYFGLLEAGRPQAGETVVVSGAAGAVGSIVGQIARLKGCRVIGIAGSDAKCTQLVEELGFDAAINYREHPGQADMQQAFARHCPDGIDIYFDNVGGVITDAVMECINLRARIIVCGQISQYSGQLDQPEMGPRFLHRILYARATIQGILSRDYSERHAQMLAAMAPWVKHGDIRYQETFMDGFASLPTALAALFAGANTGKMIVRA